MITKTIYVTPDKIYHSEFVAGAVEKTLLEAEDGKVLHRDSEPFEYLRVAVDSVDGWSEIKPVPPEDEPTVEDKAEAYDILMGGKQ